LKQIKTVYKNIILKSNTNRPKAALNTSSDHRKGLLTKPQTKEKAGHITCRKISDDVVRDSQRNQGFFGNSGTTAVLEELQQLHGRGVIEPCDSNELRQDKKVGAFE